MSLLNLEESYSTQKITEIVVSALKGSGVDKEMVASLFENYDLHNVMEFVNKQEEHSGSFDLINDHYDQKDYTGTLESLFLIYLDNMKEAIPAPLFNMFFPKFKELTVRNILECF